MNFNYKTREVEEGRKEEEEKKKIPYFQIACGSKMKSQRCTKIYWYECK
jgi:hypothetical protein